METVLITRRIDAAEFWSEIFGSGLETWPWWQEFTFLDGAEWDRPGLVRVRYEYQENKFNNAAVSLEDLVNAYNVLIKDYRLDIDNLDAGTADLILQQAIFGQVIYG